MEPEEKKIEETKKESWWDLIKFALLALAIVLPIRVFIAEPFVVSGSSMVPTFTDKDYLIIDKISYELGEPKRDDIVVFKYPNDTSKYFIKRIIAMPNETIDINGKVVTITNNKYPNGLVLEQPFLENISNDNIHLKLKNNEYFVMGDNRPASSDSRYWGPLKREFVTGRVLFRLLPLKNIDILPGQFKQVE
ncbi:MAG: signal peptidase I [Candidatus Pacebacteria bacterium]|nr:signal peptidase I [Candidatus Paceibacterota bacterium]